MIISIKLLLKIAIIHVSGSSFCAYIKTCGLVATMLWAMWQLPMIVASAQAPPSEDSSSALLLILDASGSMNSNDGSGQSKIAAAKQALYQMIDNLPEGSQVGLRVYGHRVSSSERDRVAGCRDTELISPVQALNRQAMKDAISRFQARGWTPIGSSLQAAEGDLPAAGRRTIVLVSDGLDTCGSPDPCELAHDLARRGVNLKVHTVGFQVDTKAREQLKCISEATGGTYQDASDATALSGQLKQLTARAFREFKTVGKRVEGGASYREAPRLDSGMYSDTILPGESLWYAVELQSGQEALVRATVGLRGMFGAPELKVQWVDPLLNEMICSGRSESKMAITEPVMTVGVDTGIVGTPESDSCVKRPGIYYLQVHLGNTHNRVEGPLELSVEVTGSSGRQMQTKADTSPDVSGTKAGAVIESEGGSKGSNKTIPMVFIGMVLLGFGVLAVILGALLFTKLRRQRA